MTTGFAFNPFTGNFDEITTSVDAATDITGILPEAHGGTGVSSFTQGSVIFAGATTLTEDNANFYWDDTGATLELGSILGSPGTVPFGLTVVRDATNTNGGFAGSLFLRNNSFNSINNSGLNTALYSEEHTQVDTGTTAAASAALIFNVYRDTGATDDGSLGFLAGTFGGVHQSSTGASASTNILAGVLTQIEVSSGSADTAADFYSLPTTTTGGTITNLFGIYISTPDVGFKNNWLSGRALIGGASYTAPTVELDVNGDARIRNLSTGVVHSDGSGNLSSSAVDLASEVTGVLPEVNGGTNQSTYTTGDILYASATDTLSKLPIGSSNQVLTVTAGLPSWQNSVSGSANYQISGSSGAFASSSASYVDITNLSVTITTTGNPVVLMIVPDGSGNAAFLDIQNSTGAATSQFNYVRASTIIAENSFSWAETGAVIVALDVELPVSAHIMFDPVGAGTYTYKMQGRQSSGSFQVNYVKLVAYEIK